MLLYPFVAVVGMERAKRSLMLHAVDPRIGGTLLMGHRGCAKSTLARGIAALLPPLENAPAPFTEVPLGVSEDRLLGAIHAESLVRAGAWTPQPGLLESADGGVLYVDEINLLPDAMSDLLLDSAASGMHRQERDGLSRTVSSRYILIGTMNPEEGELRPQLLDRFAHGIQITDAFSAEERVEIGKRRMAFEDDPAGFLETWAAATNSLNMRLAAARNLLHKVETPAFLRLSLAERALSLGLEGMRAELAILRTARAATALRGADTVTQEDMDEAWSLCLGHRIPEHPDPKPPASTRPQISSPRPSSPSIPIAPREAHPDSLPLSPMQKPRILALPALQCRGRSLTSPMKLTARLATSRLHTEPLLWQASLVASLKNGWHPGKAGWRWAISKSRPMRRLWAVLDASRSAGASQFLAQTRDFLAGVFHATKRVNLLLIHKSRAYWIHRNALPTSGLRALENLSNAAGKSPLPEAIHVLSRAISRSRPTKFDTVWVCSDGLPSLHQGETAHHAAGRLRSALRRLTKSLPAVPSWLCPNPSREMAGWLDKLVQGTQVRLIRVPQK